MNISVDKCHCFWLFSIKSTPGLDVSPLLGTFNTVGHTKQVGSNKKPCKHNYVNDATVGLQQYKPESDDPTMLGRVGMGVCIGPASQDV
jgi:hypothetical protein